MSEQNEGAVQGPHSDFAGFDPAVSALALNGASRDMADAHLKDVRHLIHLQMEEMRAEEPYKLSHLRLRRFSGGPRRSSNSQSVWSCWCWSPASA